jgi:Lecithin:cholesterol acyltransferase
MTYCIMFDHGTVHRMKVVKITRPRGPAFSFTISVVLCLAIILVVSQETDIEADKLATNKTDKGIFNPIIDPILALFQRRDNDDAIEDSFYDPVQPDADCDNNTDGSSCRWSPPDSTIETVSIDATCSYGGADPDEQSCKADGDATANVVIDKHWGSDPTILRIRDQLRQTGSGCSTNLTSDGILSNRRPPIFLMPGLASTRLVAWRFKSCPSHPLLSDIKVQDYVWLNINLIMQMSTLDVSCMRECLRLGRNQTDTDDLKTGCKLRPDEGLDAISSLSPGGIGSQLLVGGTNTVYAWLIQWCADNMGYDVSNIIGLPYDWRLSPDKMEQRDGFLTLTRRRIEAAVQTNGEPGIVVAHSMGNIIFRYFLSWIRSELREEAYQRFIRKAERRAKTVDQKQQQSGLDQLLNQTEKKPAFVSTVTIEEILESKSRGVRHEKLWKLAQWEGDTNWYDWIETHIWTYVGLSAPLLGAVNPLRAVISGENMGLPVTDPDARVMELTFGSTHTVNPISSKNGFCDQWDINDRWDEEPSKSDAKQHEDSKLACLDDILTEIEVSVDDKYFSSDPWEKFPALRHLLRDRSDWDTDLPMIRVIQETCNEKEKRPCAKNSTLNFGPKDVESGKLFTEFDKIWNETDHPLIVKREQLRESFWDTDIPNMLNETWERPLIKHVIMAYGVDIPTEIGYEYLKTERITAEKKDATKSDNFPNIHTAFWETAGGAISTEHFEQPKSNKLTDFWKKKQKREPLRDGKWHHSGDGSVPYLSLAWSHTWLLHAVRARRYSGKLDGNPLDDIEIRHRPEGATEWVDGPPPKRIAPLLGEKKVEESSDTGTAHPHGTKYKPEMVRYHNVGISRTTGIEYTTTVIEALAVEHKETTRYEEVNSSALVLSTIST